MASSHTSQRLRVTPDDRRVIAHAGLLLTAVLAQRLGLAEFERVHEQALGRAWERGAWVLAKGPLTIDLDSTICETYGKQKQGAARTYAKARGHQPFLATDGPDRSWVSRALHLRGLT